MSAPMKKHPTNQQFIQIAILNDRPLYLKGPKKQLKALIAILHALDFNPTSSHQNVSIPWRQVAKDNLNNHGEPSRMLRAARKKAGLTQVQLAEALGIPQYNISKMEHGSRPIGKTMATRLADVLKTDYRVFL